MRCRGGGKRTWGTATTELGGRGSSSGGGAARGREGGGVGGSGSVNLPERELRARVGTWSAKGRWGGNMGMELLQLLAARAGLGRKGPEVDDLLWLMMRIYISFPFFFAQVLIINKQIIFTHTHLHQRWFDKDLFNQKDERTASKKKSNPRSFGLSLLSASS